MRMSTDQLFPDDPDLECRMDRETGLVGWTALPFFPTSRRGPRPNESDLVRRVTRDAFGRPP